MAPGPIRIGILGAGAMGSEHAWVLGQVEGVEVAGVYSRELARAQASANPLGARALTEASALIDDPRVDAIDVCLPSALHHDVVVAALDAGKHVFCETPMALDLGEARRMVAAARRSGRLLQVGLLMRSIAPYRHIQQAVESGEHGRLLSVTAYRLGSYLRTGSSEHKAHYSEPSTELMTFDFDFVSWVMGTPARLVAEAVLTGDGAPGEISALLRYDDGRSATVLASGLMPASYPFTVGLKALFERAAFTLHNEFRDGPPTSTFSVFPQDGAAEVLALQGANPYEVELRRFVDCIRGDADPALLDGERAVEALALSVATQQSLKAAAVVDVP